ncbi:MAG: proline--tRNA ligase, partial [Acidimicrobiia bacterium]
ILPLGERVRRKVSEIIRQEMGRIGGQQFHLPALHPAEVWRTSGRWDAMGGEMFRLRDRKHADHCLAMTHEEVFAILATEIPSYRNLPQIWYQIQTKFRDEPRPKSGLLRMREFTMKDSYSLDLDHAGLDRAFDLHHQAYTTIFRRCGVRLVDVLASSGVMGGSTSVEFIVPSSAGEDWVVSCRACGYRANVERATSRLTAVVDPPDDGPLEQFPTPEIRTISALAELDPGSPPDRQIKTLAYLLDGRLTLILLRGDHELQEQKLADATGAVEIRPAHPDEVREALGVSPGSLGAVGVAHLRVIADQALHGRQGMVTGANRDDWHLRRVDIERDISVGSWDDLRAVAPGDPCPECGAPLEVWKGIEVGHIFKLGTRFSEAMGALYQDEKGASHPIVMGSYGIGVERTMAAIVEFSHDERGIVWPVSVAPYEVVVTVVRADDPVVREAGERLSRELGGEGVEVLLDDREERPGVKFADAELIGIPYRITVGPRGLEAGVVEVVGRRDGATDELEADQVVPNLVRQVETARTVGC